MSPKTKDHTAKARQKDLEENQELLQTVFDITDLGIVVFRAMDNEDGNVEDFRFVKTNRVIREMYSEKDLLGRTYRETSVYGIEMGVFDAFKNVMETGEAFDKEFYFDREGYKNWFRVTARPQANLLVATIEDVTKRKAETQELEETVRFKRELVRAAPQTIMIINLNNRNIRYINKDIFPEAGMTKEKIEGMSIVDILPFIHPRDREKVIDLHKKLLKSSDEDIQNIELRLNLKGTSWEWFNVRGKVFHRRDTSWIEEYVVLVNNITDQKKTQQALLKAEKLSIQGEVARTFAHELRNPLASFGMTTEVLKKKLGDAQRGEFDHYFNILKNSTKTLNRLLTNLLDSSNYSPAELQEQNLAEIVDEAIHRAADRIYLFGIQVIKNYGGQYSIFADKEKLVIALLNIIVNACEATTPGKGIIKIEIAEHKTDIMLSITDNGHGLEQEQIDRLFDAFYTNKDTGVGIGLSSVKNILEEHGAPVEVESKPGEGTCFKIFFNDIERNGSIKKDGQETGIFK